MDKIRKNKKHETNSKILLFISSLNNRIASLIKYLLSKDQTNNFGKAY